MAHFLFVCLFVCFKKERVCGVLSNGCCNGNVAFGEVTGESLSCKVAGHVLHLAWKGGGPPSAISSCIPPPSLLAVDTTEDLGPRWVTINAFFFSAAAAASLSAFEGRCFGTNTSGSYVNSESKREESKKERDQFSHAKPKRKQSLH